MIQQDFSKDVRIRVYEALQNYNIKQIEVSRETGINHSTLSLWLQGKIKGNFLSIKGHYVRAEEVMEQWLANLYSNKPRQIQNNISIQGGYPGSRPQPSIQQRPMTHLDNFQKIRNNQNSQSEQLIPIYFDLEFDGKKYKENLLWNLNEQQITPELFAKITAEENQLPQFIEHEIAFSIKKQIQAFKIDQKQDEKNENIKIIEIDVRIDDVNYKDRIEWDIMDKKSLPEQFAYMVCQDLGLSILFATKIANQIYDQIYQHQKKLQEQKKNDELRKKDFSNGDVLEQYIVTQQNCIRCVMNNQQDEHDFFKYWEPQIETLDMINVKKVQKIEDRKSRYAVRRR